MPSIKQRPWLWLYGLVIGAPSFLLSMAWAVAGVTAFGMLVVLALIDRHGALALTTGLWLASGLLLALVGCAGLLALYRIAHVWVRDESLHAVGRRWWLAAWLGGTASVTAFSIALLKPGSSLSYQDVLFLMASTGIPLCPMLVVFWRQRRGTTYTA